MFSNYWNRPSLLPILNETGQRRDDIRDVAQILSEGQRFDGLEKYNRNKLKLERHRCLASLGIEQLNRIERGLEDDPLYGSDKLSCTAADEFEIPRIAAFQGFWSRNLAKNSVLGFEFPDSDKNIFAAAKKSAVNGTHGGEPQEEDEFSTNPRYRALNRFIQDIGQFFDFAAETWVLDISDDTSVQIRKNQFILEEWKRKHRVSQGVDIGPLDREHSMSTELQSDLQANELRFRDDSFGDEAGSIETILQLHSRLQVLSDFSTLAVRQYSTQANRVSSGCTAMLGGQPIELENLENAIIGSIDAQRVSNVDARRQLYSRFARDFVAAIRTSEDERPGQTKLPPDLPSNPLIEAALLSHADELGNSMQWNGRWLWFSEECQKPALIAIHESVQEPLQRSMDILLKTADHKFAHAFKTAGVLDECAAKRIDTIDGARGEFGPCAEILWHERIRFDFPNLARNSCYRLCADAGQGRIANELNSASERCATDAGESSLDSAVGKTCENLSSPHLRERCAEGCRRLFDERITEAESVWQQLDTTECRKPKSLQSCHLVEVFLLRFKGSPRAKEASALLEKARPVFESIKAREARVEEGERKREAAELERLKEKMCRQMYGSRCPTEKEVDEHMRQKGLW